MVGRDFPPLFWPDIDVYFKGNLNSALALVDAIADAGGSFLKGALLHRADLASPEGDVRYFDTQSGELKTERYRDVVSRHAIPLGMMSELLAHARIRGLAVVLSVYDRAGLDFAVAAGAAAIKIPSSNITHSALIREAASYGVPLVLDTGRSSMAEIDRAVGWVQTTEPNCALLVQHSPPGPPASPEQFHMNMLAEFERRYRVPTGLSDHGSGLQMVPIAIALGASVIEKGLTVARDGDIDMAHAMVVDQLGEAIALIRNSWQSMGLRERPVNEFLASAPDRMGCYIALDLPVGHVLEYGDIDYKFPAAGISADKVDEIVGRPLLTSLSKGAPIRAIDVGLIT